MSEKCHKAGRGSSQRKAYRAEYRRERNKERRRIRTLRKQPRNAQLLLKTSAERREFDRDMLTLTPELKKRKKEGICSRSS